ncbi:thiamine pyrophosphate-binding protein, partial [Candidatus Margulisiibacteriota bacterium]
MNRILKKYKPSTADQTALSAIAINQGQLQNDYRDFSKAVVKKPWGYEYLIFDNNQVAVWVLFIRQGHATSIHCHPGKKTSIIVLSGKVHCSTLEKKVLRQSGEGILVGRGVFHRTTALSEGGAYVMEIETPVNKRDLVRYKDKYGREKQGYENINRMSFNLKNYNYISLIDPSAYYNVKKRFGSCSIELARFSDSAGLQKGIKRAQWDALAILKGKLNLPGSGTALCVGDTIGREEIDNLAAITIKDELEVIIIKKLDTKIRVAEYIISYFKQNGIKDFFFVPETSNAHLIDALGRDTEVCSFSFKTSLGATLAAEAAAKYTNQPCVVVVATGASGTAAITGIANAWIDSAPVIVLSSQSRLSPLGPVDSKKIRQLANKELDIVNMVKPITKYANAATKINE